MGDRAGLVRQIKAVLVVDLVESVRLMQADEAEVIRRWRLFVQAVRQDILPRFQGRMVKSLGDGMLLEFDHTAQAMGAAHELHRLLAAQAGPCADASRMALRVGLHEAEVVSDEFDIYGVGVNLAARLAGLADPGGCVVSAEARHALVPGVDADFEDMGQCWLKNLGEPVRAWRARAPAAAGAVSRLELPPDQLALQLRLAVLPLSDPQLQGRASTLGSFVAEELITRLTRQPCLSVISSLSSQILGERQLGIQAQAAMLGVRYLLRGSCAEFGGRLRIYLELVDARGLDVVWADSTVEEMGALLIGEGERLSELVSRLMRALVGAEVLKAESFPLPTLDSFSLLLSAVAKLHRLTLDEFQRAHQMLELLAERHPRSPIPRAWMGKWHVMRIGQGWSPDPQRDGQQAAYHTASALDLQPDHALSLTLDGFVAAYVRRDVTRAQQRYDAALAANPSESLAWLFKSALLAYGEEHQASADCVQQALGLSPLDPMRYYYEHFAALSALLAGDHARAIAMGERSLAGNRTHASTLRVLVMALALGGEPARARILAQELLRLEPGLTQNAFRRRYPGWREAQIDTLCQGLDLAGIPPGP